MKLKRENVRWPMVFDGGFRVREADAETDGKCHRGQARPGAAGGGRIKVETGDKDTSATGSTVTKNHKGYNADASVRRVCGWNEVEDTVSPCPLSEDLEDLEQSGKAFKSGEEKAGSIDNIGASRYLAYGRLL